TLSPPLLAADAALTTKSIAPSPASDMANVLRSMNSFLLHFHSVVSAYFLCAGAIGHRLACALGGNHGRTFSLCLQTGFSQIAMTKDLSPKFLSVTETCP